MKDNFNFRKAAVECHDPGKSNFSAICEYPMISGLRLCADKYLQNII